MSSMPFACCPQHAFGGHVPVSARSLGPVSVCGLIEGISLCLSLYPGAAREQNSLPLSTATLGLAILEPVRAAQGAGKAR